MTIKKLLFQEIESSPDSLLEETLDFLRFLKTKQEADKKDTPASPVKSEDTQRLPESNSKENSQSPYRPASGRSILRHARTWEGDDFQKCLQSVYATRGKAKFDCQ
ncbi:DUF2281 domain-containing protein [Nodularia harveyana UHCC-0300]|uniref:DUF2281 domain-containing protein n=1 Tax=Nodularia harveyana UHCC-0300 TaxID=2974287 RepID=A0ABU5UB50_9CYAN|nr:DUF2281 domain-containing protein [Nodularia harveyana]MEA5580759.1 DUF2281 domain-containing protein [Nodularia harveyana UHCC-0300]